MFFSTVLSLFFVTTNYTLKWQDTPLRPFAPRCFMACEIAMQPAADTLDFDNLCSLARSHSRNFSCLLQQYRQSIRHIHHWECAATVELDHSGNYHWVEDTRRSVTRNRTKLVVTNRTVMCVHIHPSDSVPWPSFQDRQSARMATRGILQNCRRYGLENPPVLWMLTLHASGELWAWRDGWKTARIIGNVGTWN